MRNRQRRGRQCRVFFRLSTSVAEGVFSFRRCGDSGAAGCDNGATVATHGIGLNAFASTPYNVAVGWHRFQRYFSGTNLNYWNSTNSPAFGSAISYVPEIPWNDSCAGTLVSAYLGYSPTYGPNQPVQQTIAGRAARKHGRRRRRPASALRAVHRLAACQRFVRRLAEAFLASRSWLIPTTASAIRLTFRYLPRTVSGAITTCSAGRTQRTAAHPVAADPSAWSGAGGTSFASPIMAGIQALINQKAGGPQGNPAPVYYQLAAEEFVSDRQRPLQCIQWRGGLARPALFYDSHRRRHGRGMYRSQTATWAGQRSVFSPPSMARLARPTERPWVGTLPPAIGSVNAANLVNNCRR
jgi:hypothetical protein